MSLPKLRFQARGGKNPWNNPSKSAIAKVSDQLPAPTVCPCCGGRVDLVENDEIYGRHYGDWPYAFLCRNLKCGAYVGLHPYTDIPLGTLANEATRKARTRAKGLFNVLWQGGAGMTRSDAYAWLAARLGLPVEQCHFGWFDAAQCERAAQLCIEFSHPQRSNEA